MEYIYDGRLTCSCGYHAVVDDGIVITPNGYNGEVDKPDLTRELYKDLPPSLISLFQRSYNYMKEELEEMDLSGKVVMETYINAWFFLHNHQQCFSPKGFYIVVDKYPETLHMSHTCALGEPYEQKYVRAAMLLRCNALSRGFSGIRLSTIQTMVDMDSYAADRI